MFKQILFATSGSPASDGAARVAFALAAKHGARLTVFHVLGVPGKGDSTRVFDVRTGEAVVVRVEGIDEDTAAEAIERLARTW